MPRSLRTPPREDVKTEPFSSDEEEYLEVVTIPRWKHAGVTVWLVQAENLQSGKAEVTAATPQRHRKNKSDKHTGDAVMTH